jgi:hypothetical protein
MFVVFKVRVHYSCSSMTGNADRAAIKAEGNVGYYDDKTGNVDG